MVLMNRRSTLNTSLRRRGGKKFSQATLLRMLLTMLAVIFILYVALLITVASVSHQDPLPNPPLRSQLEKQDTPIHRDLRPPNGFRDTKGRLADDDKNEFMNGEQNQDDPDESEHIQERHRDGYIRVQRDNVDQNPLRAYLEPIDQSQWDIKPLPVRKTSSKDLKVVPYPALTSCQWLTEQWPVDDYPDEDPFLPWIHDVFPTHDGKFIQFVAQNKRRCHTGTTPPEKAILKHTQPQLALFQHVPVKRVEDGRYRLAAHNEADPDGVATRFICRFKPDMEETLSIHNIPYDYVAFRKGHKQTFTEEGKWDIKSLHTTQLIFQCPVPEHLQQTVREGTSVQDDFATLFVDLIPIRTPPRYSLPNAFLPPKYADFITTNKSALFDPSLEWGDSHILPRIEDSGRWENIPICKPSLLAYETDTLTIGKNAKDEPSSLITDAASNKPLKKHRLVACVWASANYATRGERFAIDDGQRRLNEWIHFNFLVGFDHIYIYDNSGAHNNMTSLKPITDQFPGRVTRIVWPSKICNNNRNFADSPGERSSQYAAESSCRLRFGPHVEWIGALDVDEYVVPVGKYNGLLPLLDKLDREGKKIVSFGSWRAWPRKVLIEPPIPIHDFRTCGMNQACFVLKVPVNRTVLQTYNCDRQKGSQKKEQMPAEKQLYRPDYVRQHFIHYSTVTDVTMMNRTETEAAGVKWTQRVHTDPKSRFADEIKEGTMLHTKAIATQDTAGWLSACKDGSKGMCRIGNPYPPGAEEANITADKDGWSYNCYVNDKIEEYWVPRLEESLGLTR